MDSKEIQKERFKEIEKRLIKLTDVKKATVADTSRLFKVHHEKLVEAFQYWFEQIKLVFGEPIMIRNLQGLNDAGVDILFELPNSDLKIGIQIKSWYDISEKMFPKKLKSQILEKDKHQCDIYLIAFAGDLTETKKTKAGKIEFYQANRISSIISEISQINKTKKDKILTLLPQHVVTIYDTFLETMHPLKNLNLEISDRFMIAQGIKEAFTSEDRDVIVNIDIVNKNQKPHEGIKKSIQYQMIPTDKNIQKLADFENILYTDEVLTLSSDDEFRMKFMQDDYEKSEITAFVEKPNRMLVFITTINSMNQHQMYFVVYDMVSEKGTLQLNDVSNRCFQLNMVFYEDPEKRPQISCVFNPTLLSKVSIPNLVKEIKMVNSINMASPVVFHHNNKVIVKLRRLTIGFPNYFTDIVYLAQRLENTLGIELLIREADLNAHTFTDLRHNLACLEDVEFIITEGLSDFVINLNKGVGISILKDFMENKISANRYIDVNFVFDILNHRSVVNLPINIFHLKPKGDIQSLLAEAEKSNQEMISIPMSKNLPQR
jgi:hypothetical protein